MCQPFTADALLLDLEPQLLFSQGMYRWLSVDEIGEYLPGVGVMLFGTDDRDLVRTNLIESYDRVLAFVKKHLSDPFYLEGIERRSLRDIIFREVASNMLIHREYSSGATSRLIIEYGRVVTDNPSRPHGFGLLNPETAVPFQKNPVLSAFFRVIDRADEQMIRKVLDTYADHYAK